MATAPVTGKPLIESDRVEGTTVYDPAGNNIGSIKRLMIEKLSGRVAYSVMSFGGFLGMGSPVEQAHVRYLSGRLSYRCDGKSTTWDWTDRNREKQLQDVLPTTGSGSKYRRLRHTAVLGIRNNNFFD
jgi:hypothetical protein